LPDISSEDSSAMRPNATCDSKKNVTFLVMEYHLFLLHPIGLQWFNFALIGILFYFICDLLLHLSLAI
jgi:hypothetical protein